MASTNATRLVTRKDVCEVCKDSGVITVIQSAHGIWMCQEHWNQEQLTIAAQKTLDDSRKVDTGVTTRHDVFVSAPTPIIELKGAIQNDSTIPDGEKTYALVKELNTRLESLNKAIFDGEELVKAQKAERMVVIANAQNLVATLRVDLRSQFGNLNISMPVTTRTVKPAKSPKLNKSDKPVKAVKPGKRSFTRADLVDLNEAAEKYGVPSYTLQSFLQNNDSSYEDGARKLAEMMGLLPTT